MERTGLEATGLQRRGVPLAVDVTPVVLVHGRDRDPDDMFGVVDDFPPLDVAWLALTAPGGSWYPESFMAPIEDNQPDLDRSLATLHALVEDLGRAGHPPERVVLVGFSQGACMVAEYALRRPRRYGGLVLWTGSTITEPPEQGGLDGTPTYLTNGDADPWIPEEHSARTADLLRARGADVTYEVRVGRDHVVDDRERAQGLAIIRAVAARR